MPDPRAVALATGIALALAAAAPAAAAPSARAPSVAAQPAATAGAAFRDFADVAFGSTHDAVKAALLARGYAYVKSVGNDGTLDDRFHGDVAGQSADIIAQFDGTDRLGKVIVYLLTADADAVAVYRTLLADLTSKYGTPTRSNGTYTSPYREGDGKTEAAIRAGKADLSAYWDQPDGDAIVGMSITDQLTVRFAYEGPSWHAYIQTLKAESAKDL